MGSDRPANTPHCLISVFICFSFCSEPSYSFKYLHLLSQILLLETEETVISLHANEFNNVLQSPQAFFQTTQFQLLQSQSILK